MFVFTSKLDFYQWIAKRFPIFDLNASLWVSGFGYQLKNQAAQVLPNLEWMLDYLNKDMQSNFDKDRSYMLNGFYHIVLHGDTPNELKVSDEKQSDTTYDAKVVQDEIATEPDLTDAPNVTVDWVYAESLNDSSQKSESKDKLEEYAREFNVELKKNKTFANMMKDFRTAIEG